MSKQVEPLIVTFKAGLDASTRDARVNVVAPAPANLHPGGALSNPAMSKMHLNRVQVESRQRQACRPVRLCPSSPAGKARLARLLRHQPGPRMRNLPRLRAHRERQNGDVPNT